MGKYGKGRAARGIGKVPVQKPPTTAPLKYIEPQGVTLVYDELIWGPNYIDPWQGIWGPNYIDPWQGIREPNPPSAVSRRDRAKVVIDRELRTPQRSEQAARIADVMQSIMDAQGVTQDKLSDDMFIELLTFCCELGQYVAPEGWPQFIGEKSAEFIKRFKEGQ